MDERPTPDLDARRFWRLVGGAALAIMLGCWLCSGTLAPYGTRAAGPCHYRTNVDGPQFEAVFHMIDGAPAHDWDGSVVLRRILHPLLAYPLMKAFGFDLGGLLFNILSHGAALIGLALVIRRYFDARAAILVSWLFASYPGYAYWAGLPYSYAFIVPGSILCTCALLWWDDRPSLRRTVVAACAVGFVGLGYDLMPYFGGALLLMILMRRRWLDLPVALVTLGAWAMFIGRGLPAIFGFPALNSNTQAYHSVIEAYLDITHRFAGWVSMLAAVPHVLVSNFFRSGMLLFPILLLWVIALRLRWRIRPVFGRVALCVLLATLGVFLFLNLAPPYDDAWQLRGTWIARVYQPWFVAVLLVVAATSAALREHPRRYRLLLWSVVIIAVLDGVAIVGPYARLDYLYVRVNQGFYQHPDMLKNRALLRTLGRRPYGVCE